MTAAFEAPGPAVARPDKCRAPEAPRPVVADLDKSRALEAAGAAGTILVLGIGNVLLKDEGVGVAVVRALAESSAVEGARLPPGTEIVDGGTLGLDLLPMLEDASAALLVDAIDLRRPPGTVAVLTGGALHTALAQHVSPHQVGVGDLLSAARLSGRLTPRVALVGVQPGAIEIGLELTQEVAAAIPKAVDACREELWHFSTAVRPAGG